MKKLSEKKEKTVKKRKKAKESAGRGENARLSCLKKTCSQKDGLKNLKKQDTCPGLAFYPAKGSGETG